MQNPYASQPSTNERRSSRLLVYSFLSAWALLTVLAFSWMGIYPLYLNSAAPSPDHLKSIDKVVAPLR